MVSTRVGTGACRTVQRAGVRAPRALLRVSAPPPAGFPVPPPPWGRGRGGRPLSASDRPLFWIIQVITQAYVQVKAFIPSNCTLGNLFFYSDLFL